MYWIGRLGKDWHWIGVIFLMNDGLVKDYQIGIGLGDYQRIGTVFLNWSRIGNGLMDWSTIGRLALD